MHDGLELYVFDTHEVRVVFREDGAPRFVASDVLRILGVDRTSLGRLDSDEMGVDSIHTPGGRQDMTTVTEPGLYSLVLASRKPEAKRFKRWVTHDILPSIRKTGAYNSAPAFPMPKTFAEALRLAADQQERLEAQAKELEAARPAVAFLDNYVEAKSTQAIRTVAKVLGAKEKAFISWLVEEGVLFRQSGRLMPSAEYQHSGFFEVKTGESNGHAFAQTRFTPGGVSWIADRYARSKAR